MRIRMVRFILLSSVLTVFAASEALAWGPKAQSAIANTALKMLRVRIPEAFRGEDTSYEKDMLSGAQEGYQALGSELPAKNADQAMASVAMEIDLLRGARKYRTGSYFSYRMGVLAALAADVLVPYGIPQAREEYLKEQIEADIDAHMKSFTFQPRNDGKLQEIRMPVAYLAEQRKFFPDARQIIAADYAGGKGFDGYLKTGAEDFFKGAIEGVADVWYTVLSGTAGTAPSDRALTDYFVREIDYLLNVKKNPNEAEKAYGCLASINKNDLKAYERVGDIYYDYGLKDRGVQEWKTALALTGPERQEVLRKLASHYLKSGRETFESASSPDASDTALEDALKSFEMALEYDPESKEAGERLSETRLAIQEKRERYDLVVRIIATGEKVMREAQANEASEAYSEAIAQYQRAKLLYNSVNQEFKKEHQAALDGVLLANNQISKIINNRLDAADELIDQGDACIENEDFPGALDKYSAVKTTLDVLPADAGANAEQHKKQLLDDMTKKIADVEVRKKEAEDRKQKEAARLEQEKKYREQEQRKKQQQAAEKPKTEAAPAK